MSAPVGLALITAVVGRVTELMVVPVPHQGQLPVPAGMLVPKAIQSPLATPLPVANADIITVELPVDDGVTDVTVVPGAIALGVVISWIVMPGVILVVATFFGKVRVLLVLGVAAFVGVPASVTTAHGDPVLNAVAAVILVAKESVLVVVAVLAVFTTPEYPAPPEDDHGAVVGNCGGIIGLVQPISAVAWPALVTGGNTKRATSSNGVGVDAPQVPWTQGQSSFNRVWIPSAAQSTALLKPAQADPVVPPDRLAIDAVVSRINATLNGPTAPPFALATAVAEIDHGGAWNRLAKNTGTVAVSVTSMMFAEVAGVWFVEHAMPQPDRHVIETVGAATVILDMAFMSPV
ncbi:MAG: hypothetical protein WBX30_13235 [Stellaceae bacterium]